MSGKPDAKMYWTPSRYYNCVLSRYRYRLVGWPPDAFFGNLSDLRGGLHLFDELLFRWHHGILHWVTISDAEFCKLDKVHAIPGVPLPQMPRAGRNDLKKARFRPLTNPMSLPLRRPRLGPKSDKFVCEDLEAGSSCSADMVDEIEEEDIVPTVEDDPIEDW